MDDADRLAVEHNDDVEVEMDHFTVTVEVSPRKRAAAEIDTQCLPAVRNEVVSNRHVNRRARTTGITYCKGVNHDDDTVATQYCYGCGYK